MKYMLMMSGTKSDMQSFGTLSPDDIRAHIAFMKKLNEELKASAELVDAQGLAGPDQAKVVRSRPGGGPPAVTDGPFPEAKEFLAGYWIVECANFDRAVEIAARASAAPGRGGVPLNIPIEMRAIGEAPEG